MKQDKKSLFGQGDIWASADGQIKKSTEAATDEALVSCSAQGQHTVSGF